MAPVSIHTVATAKTTYVRIVDSPGTTPSSIQPFIGRVGLMTASTGTNMLVFVRIDGKTKVFNRQNIQEISKKEYFKGLLKQ